jgi:hypothetical protein
MLQPISTEGIARITEATATLLVMLVAEEMSWLYNN